MFTGIIESLGQIKAIEQEGSNVHFTIESNISSELKIDQSIAHNGVCLTVTDCDEKIHKVTAIQESLRRSNLGKLSIGDKVNLERCMKVNDRLDGHFVQGHVDQTATCTKVEDQDGSWNFFFEFDGESSVIVPKGSITVNGVSLTLVEATDKHFSVSIIPFTFEHTTFKNIKEGDKVNIEFDILGKYIEALFLKHQTK